MRTEGFVLLLMLLVARWGFADYVYEIEVTDHTSSPSQVETLQMSVAGRNLKMEMAAASSQGSANEMRYRGEQREMVMIDHDSKSYFVIDPQTVRGIGEQYNQAMSQMQEMLKNVPAEQRAMFEKMMQGRMPQPPAQQPASSRSELRKTGKRAVKAGYTCELYEVWENGDKRLELCVTPWDKVAGGREVKPVFEEMAALSQDMMQSFMGAGRVPGGFASQTSGQFFAHLKQLDGFPVMTTEFEDGSPVRESVLRSAKRQALAPAAFELPAGYTQGKMMGGR